MDGFTDLKQVDDASEGDPTVQKEGGDYFSAVGYFPQAGRRFYVGLKFTL